MTLIDWEQFEGVVDFSDPDCGEIYDEFVEEVPGQLEDLRAVCVSADHSGAANLAHRLRGSCLTFGMAHVSQILTDLESGAKAGQEIAPENWYQQVKDAFDESIHAVSLRRTG